MSFFGRIRFETDLKKFTLLCLIVVFCIIQLSECDVVVKYNYNGDDYYEIGKISQDPANPASKHCDVSKLKENEEYQSKSITITTLHKGNF